MEKMKIAMSVEENGHTQSLEIELNRIETHLYKPVIKAEDSASGFKTVTELPAQDYSRLVQNLSRVVVKYAENPSKIGRAFLRIFSLVSEGAGL